jgi:hypothetical protein
MCELPPDKSRDELQSREIHIVVGCIHLSSAVLQQWERGVSLTSLSATAAHLQHSLSTHDIEALSITDSTNSCLQNTESTVNEKSKFKTVKHSEIYTLITTVRTRI